MRKRPKLIWYLFPSYFLVTLFAVTAMGWEASGRLRSLFLEQTISKLRSEAFLVGEILEGASAPMDSGWIDPLCKRIGPKIASRVTVIVPSGRVVGDSDKDPSQMDDHAARPEVRAAREGKVTSCERYSASLGKVMVYLATPVTRSGHLIAVVRTAVPVKVIAAVLEGVYWWIAIEGIAIVIGAALMGFYISYRIKKPISQVQEAAARFAAGDLDYRVQFSPASEEMGSLVESINTMAAELRDRIQTVTVQRNELEAILTGMKEAVLLFDTDERIILANRAAIKLFEIADTPPEGRYILEVIRSNDLRDFVQNALTLEGALESEIFLLAPSERYLLAYGTKLRDGQGRNLGVLVVLNDVTRLKNMERVRRDFVTNAAHELKTPLTAIKGFLETLREGAIDDPDQCRRFLEIIMKNTDRLSWIVEDLLALSRTEEIEEKGGIRVETALIEGVLADVSAGFADVAKRKDIELAIQCETGLLANVNPQLLCRAVSNLVDNALRFSETGSTVTVVAEKTAHDVVIRVIDHGPGIARDQVYRIFERFYKTGSPTAGEKVGTGLGLSVAKHIVQAHDGKIEVETKPGKGSTFTIHLPAV